MSAPVAVSGKERVPELDGVRALAFLSVFIFHTFNVPLTWAGVDAFFVLSGFLITGILLREKGKPGYFRRFYERRARRILPPLALFLIAATVVFGAGWLRHWYWYVLFSANIAQALHKVDHESLGVLWSLAVEEQFYLIWPVVVFLLPEKAIAWSAGALLLIVPVLRAGATPFFSDFAPIFHLTPFRMDLLAAGALLACLARKNAKLFAASTIGVYITGAVAGCALLGFSAFSWFKVSANSVPGNALLYSLTLLVSASLLIVALNQSGRASWLLRLKPLQYLGVISYSMYLIHYAIILWLRGFVSNTWAIFAPFADRNDRL